MNANYNPEFKLFHANAKGTGSVIYLSLHPAYDDHDGFVKMKIANQLAVGDYRTRTPVSFDWDNAYEYDLTFSDITQILQVLHGETESINDDKGIYYRGDDNINAVIRLKHIFEPSYGYSLSVVTHKTGCDEAESKYTFLFDRAEALGICIALENCIGAVCFGIPNVISE